MYQTRAIGVDFMLSMSVVAEASSPPGDAEFLTLTRNTNAGSLEVWAHNPVTAVSRLPADMNENAPCPRSGALKPAFCGDVLPPGMSGPRSTKCRPFSGIS